MKIKPHSFNTIKAITHALVMTVAISPACYAYQLYDLGANVQPTGINNSDTIVGAKNTDQYPTTAFIWTAANGYQNLNGTIATAINDNNEVSGNTLTGAFYYNGNSVKYIGDDYTAEGINSLGQLAGSKSKTNPYRATPRPVDPAIYDANSNGQKWSILDIAKVYSRGTRQGVYADIFTLLGINDAGYAVGKKSRYGLSGTAAFITSPAFDSVTFIPTPNGGYATAINNQNNVVGATGSNSSLGEYSFAFLYDGNTLTNLGTLPVNGSGSEPGLTSYAFGINDANQVVGSSRLITALTSLNDPTKYHAFLWENGQINDLNDLVINLPSDWILTRAVAINENGHIVGLGLKAGVEHGFLLTTDILPPSNNEPPVAIAIADNTSGKANLTVNFSATDSYDPEGMPLSYQWDFADGSGFSSAPNPTHVYYEPGTYTAVLIVTDDQGLTSSDQINIVVRKKSRKNR